MMKTYIGIKKVKAQPMTAAEAVQYGYKVGNHKDGYEIEYPDGYKSWSPKEAFENAYHVVDDSTELSFGDVLCLIKQGATVKRKDWGDKDISMLTESMIEKDSVVELPKGIDFVDGTESLIVRIGEYADAYTPDLDDMFANDWQIVE